MDRNPYEVLGVPRTAGPDEIKKSFRRLARIYHPDFNPGDAVAERKFKEVQAAYDLLSDPSKRRLFDRLGAAAFVRGRRRDPNPKSAKDIINEAVESLLRKTMPQQKRGEDLRYYAAVGLEDVLHGTFQTLSVRREVECEVCRGTGADGAGGRISCPTCEGLGEVRPKGGFFAFRRPCSSCGGTGYKVVKPCSGCAGRGRRAQEDTLKVRIPPGVETGQRLKVRERGNGGYLEGEPGDLFVVVHVKDHSRFRREGSELLVDVPVSGDLAASGGRLEVPTLTGTAVITLPGGVVSGRLFRLRGQGLPKGSSARGDLHIRIVVVGSPQPSDKQRSGAGGEDVTRNEGDEVAQEGQGGV